jgi:hypothetical protein
MRHFAKIILLVQFFITYNFVSYGQNPRKDLFLDSLKFIHLTLDTIMQFNDYKTYQFIFLRNSDSLKITVRTNYGVLPMAYFKNCYLDTGITYAIFLTPVCLNDSDIKDKVLNYSFYKSYCDFYDPINCSHFKLKNQVWKPKTKKKYYYFSSKDRYKGWIYEVQNQIYLIEQVNPCTQNRNRYYYR